MGVSAYGTWASSLDALISYRHVGCRSVATDDGHATGGFALRSDLRLAAGVLGAPVAIAVLDTAGINIDGVHILALTRVDVHLFEGAGAVDRIVVLGTVVRRARTMVFTEARLVDAADHGRTIGFGTADWVVIEPTPPGFAYVDPGPGVPDEPPMPPLWGAYGAEPLAGGGFEIATLSAQIGAERMHHGPMLVVTEAAAIEAIKDAGVIPTGVQTLSTRLVKAATRPPFRTRAEVLTATPSTVACRAELYDADGNTVATTFVTVPPDRGEHA